MKYLPNPGLAKISARRSAVAALELCSIRYVNMAGNVSRPALATTQILLEPCRDLIGHLRRGAVNLARADSAVKPIAEAIGS